MDFKNYLQRKQQLQKTIHIVLALLDELQLNHIQEKLRNDQHKLADEKFTLVVIGEFSRGKSTFVNAMLGKPVLPSSKQPTTNIISKIVYGTRPSYVLYYRDGNHKIVSDKEFLEIKAQADVDPSDFEKVKRFFKKTEDFSKIDFAKIAYPLSFCQNNVEVVDTPGTNDLNVGRMEITYRYLQNAEAAILLLGADQALSKSEKEFLRERVIGNQIQDIFIVINYKDVLSGPEEEEKVKQYVLNNLADIGNFSKRIFMVSSKQALLFRRKEGGETLKAKTLLMLPDSMEETGFPEFEKTLAHFLSEEKGRAKLNKYINCCEMALTEIENCLSTRREAASHSADELRVRLREQRPKFERTKAETRRIIQSFRSRLMIEESRLEQEANLTANRIKQAAVAALDGYTGGMDNSEIQYLVAKAVTPIQKQFIEEANEIQQQAIQNETVNAVKHLQKIWKDMDFSAESLPISQEIATLSYIDTDTRQWSINKGASMTAIGVFLIGSILADPVFGIGMAAYMWFKSGGRDPLKDWKGEVKNQVRQQYDEILNGFSNEIVKQYRNTVNEICNSMQKEIDNRLDTMEQQLNMLIADKDSKERDINREEELLKRQFAEIDKIRINLTEVLRE